MGGSGEGSGRREHFMYECIYQKMDETTRAVWTKLLPVSKLVSKGKMGCYVYTAQQSFNL